MIRRKSMLVTVFASALAFLAAGGGTKLEAQARNAPIRIGIVAPLTGAIAAFGQAHKRGYTIALDELNVSGGVLGRNIELVYYDDQGRPDQAVQGVSKLVDQDRVPIIVGSFSSESTKAMVLAATQKQVPLLMPTANADNVMETGSQWVFRICAGSSAYASATTNFLENNGRPKTMAIVYENTNFGHASEQAMLDAARQAGINIVDIESYQAASPDYRALLQRVKAKNPEVVYFASYLLDATTLMRQAEEVGLNPKYYTAAGTGFAASEFPTPDKGAGRNAEYTLSVNQWYPSAKWKGSKEFDEKHFQQYGSHPTYHAMEAYAALKILAIAINNAKSTDPTAIRNALRQLELPETPFGPIKFDLRGQNSHPVLITQVLGGRFRVVWPPEAAEAQPVIPTPRWDQR